MNIMLWILQILLALHTAMGAVWKFGNSEQTVPPLQALPHGIWQGLSVVEILCVLGLVLPFIKGLGKLAPVAALVVAAEMLLFCGLFVFSGSVAYHFVVYWLVVAALAGFIAYGRLALKPL